MYRLNEESVSFLPKIPAQPIGYSEAQVILQYETYFANFNFSHRMFHLDICKVLKLIRHGVEL
jgi:hypothetical protein